MEPDVGFTGIIQALLIIVVLALWVWLCLVFRRRLREDWERQHPDFETNDKLVTRFRGRRPRTLKDVKYARLLQSEEEEEDLRAFFQEAPGDEPGSGFKSSDYGNRGEL